MKNNSLFFHFINSFYNHKSIVETDRKMPNALQRRIQTSRNQNETDLPEAIQPVATARKLL